MMILLGVCVLLLCFTCFTLWLLRARKVRSRAQLTQDPATGCLNANGFRKKTVSAFAEPKASYAYVMLKILNFRQIMQTFGCEKSDEVLRHVCRVLKSQLSAAEPVGRTDSGTFCFLMKYQQETVITARLQRIRENVNQFLQPSGMRYVIELCFGIYVPRTNAESAAQIHEKAAEALEQAGRDNFCVFFRTDGEETASRKWEILGAMEQSLKNGDFLLCLQPVIRLSDNQIVRAEASLRWRHPQRGLLTPEMFYPLLEEYGMTARYDLYLFELVCRQLQKWIRAGWTPCPVSLRICGETLKAGGCLDTCIGIGKQYGIIPELIEIGLGEQLQKENAASIGGIVEQIHRAGFRCSLDGFGKDALSLHLLREISVDSIKLDRSLLSAENNNRRNRFVVEALLKLTTQLQIHTVADGIDNGSQVQYLKQAGCEMIQGVYYFKPMSAEEFSQKAYLKGQLRSVEENVSQSMSAADLSAHQEAGNIIMFSLNLATDTIAFSALFSPVLEGQFTVSGALSLFRHSTLIHENDRKDFFRLLERCQKESGWVDNMIRFYTAKGRYEWLEVHLHHDSEPGMGEETVSGTLVNVAGWKNEVDRWREKATRDALTGLYNREYFENYAENAIENPVHTSSAIVFVDIDDFKRVNDTLGHMMGDDVIRFVAKRILGTFRHSDVVARYGGDEFVIFVNGIGKDDLEKRLKQFCEAFRYPYRNGAVEYPVSGSIGAAMFPQDADTYARLLDCADSAAYHAKRAGKNRFVMYQPGMEETAQ
ncbi:MAG: diguanylate cyclase [Oscillospiraceae bacterium]|nr:diguanylate cyclase [Oscillospiraceae bacterium]